MIGIDAVSASSFSARHTSKPEMSGISTSSRMRSGRGAPNALSIAVPGSEAVITS
jgi:hypothetical protein